VGALWDVYRQFAAEGFSLDAQAYTTCFRVAKGSRSQGELEAALKNLPEGQPRTLSRCLLFCCSLQRKILVVLM
jgi:hypothetical protein